MRSVQLEEENRLVCESPDYPRRVTLQSVKSIAEKEGYKGGFFSLAEGMLIPWECFCTKLQLMALLCAFIQ